MWLSIHSAAPGGLIGSVHLRTHIKRLSNSILRSAGLAGRQPAPAAFLIPHLDVVEDPPGIARDVPALRKLSASPKIQSLVFQGPIFVAGVVRRPLH